MAKRKYDEQFKERVVKEVLQIGDLVLVAERHAVPQSTVRSWVKKYQAKIWAGERLQYSDKELLPEERKLIEVNYRLLKLLEQSEEEKQRMQAESKRREWGENLPEILARLLRLLLYVLRIKV